MKTETKNKIFCCVLAAFVLIFSVLYAFLPKESYSLSERRKLADMPKLTVKDLLNGNFMEDFEKYVTDNLPARDSFRTVKALNEKFVFMKKDTNNLYSYNGYITNMEYTINTKALAYASEKIESITQKYLTSNNVYLSIIPDKNYFLSKQSGHLSLDYERLIKIVTERTPGATYLNIFPLLALEDYYKTDSHWKQQNITDVAQFLASAMGTTIAIDFKENTLERPFYGVYHGQLALPIKGDKMVYLTNDITENASVYNMENQTNTTVYNLEKAAGYDMYELFLSGAVSIITMENPAKENGKNLVIFRDSFSSSIAPLMLSGYSKITLVDIRYISSDRLADFISFENSDILFLYSASVLNNGTLLK